MIRSGISVAAIAILFSLAMLQPAYAYIDLGTGSMVFQMLMAGAIGVFFTIKMYWISFKQKFRRALRRITGHAETTEDQSGPGLDETR